MRKLNRTSLRHRRAISLIEVIASLTIVGLMLVPLSAVMRSSRQAITRAEDRSTEQQLRDGSNWLHRLIQDNQLIDVYSDALVLHLKSGDDVKIYVQSDALVMNDGSKAVEVMADVRQVAFGKINHPSDPSRAVGVKMAIEMTDPTSGIDDSLTTVVSLPPQL